MHSVGFVLFAIVCRVWANENWFPHSTYLGVEYVLDCSLNVSVSNNTINWYLPNGQLIKPSDKYILDKQFLHIKDVSTKDTGVYSCKVEGMNETFSQKHTLNIGGPMYYTISEKYYWNFVVGVVAGVGACLLIISLALIYHFRYRNPKLSRLQNDLLDDYGMSYDTKL